MRKFFETKHHAALYAKYRPELPQSIIERILEFMKKRNSDFMYAVDVGCGNGQSTYGFGKHFTNVVGVDTSLSQITEAKLANKAENVKFEVGDGENIPLPDNSIDLISTCMAVHWFDLPTFFKECNRVLKQNGCMLICGHTDPVFYPKFVDGKATQSEFQQRAKIPFQNLLSNYTFHKRVSHLYNHYSEIFETLNAREKEHEKDIEHKTEMSLNDFLCYLSTWSPYQNFVQEQKENKEQSEDVLDVFAAELKRSWNIAEVDNDKIPLCVIRYYFTVMSGRPIRES